MSSEIQGYNSYNQTIIVLNTLSVLFATVTNGFRKGLVPAGATFGACLLFGMVWLFLMGAIAVALDRLTNRTPLAILSVVKNIGMLAGPLVVSFIAYPL